MWRRLQRDTPLSLRLTALYVAILATVLVVLGFVLVFSPHALTHGTSLGDNPSWHSIAFALPLAMLAYTGLETVAIGGRPYTGETISLQLQANGQRIALARTSALLRA